MEQTDIEDLASCIYPVLKNRARSHNPISYSALCRQLSGRWAGLSPRSHSLAASLGTIVEACRDADLPALSALVVHAGSDQRPGEGYFHAAHPNLTGIHREVAWAAELKAMRNVKYPETLNALRAMRRA